jgi:hypothetical protein
MTRIPPLDAGYITAASHTLAAAGVTFVAVGASAVPGTSALPNQGFVLLLFTVLLRVVLLKHRFGETVPYSPTGPELSITAALLFIANALASLGCLVAPHYMLPLLAYSALDVTAAWLNMVALTKAPALPRFPILVSVLGFSADAHLAAIVCGLRDVSLYTTPAIVMKSAHSVYVMVNSARAVVDRDTAKRDRRLAVSEESKKAQ